MCHKRKLLDWDIHAMCVCVCVYSHHIVYMLSLVQVSKVRPLDLLTLVRSCLTLTREWMQEELQVLSEWVAFGVGCCLVLVKAVKC